MTATYFMSYALVENTKRTCTVQMLHRVLNIGSYW
jgi:hypothetical protein